MVPTRIWTQGTGTLCYPLSFVMQTFAAILNHVTLYSSIWIEFAEIIHPSPTQHCQSPPDKYWMCQCMISEILNIQKFLDPIWDTGLNNLNELVKICQKLASYRQKNEEWLALFSGPASSTASATTATLTTNGVLTSTSVATTTAITSTRLATLETLETLGTLTMIRRGLVLP